MDYDEEIKQVLGLLKKIKRSNTKKIDGKILSCALRLVFFSDLKKKEISSLKISDVKYQNGQIYEIDPGSSGQQDKPISLSILSQKILKNYLKYLNSNKAYSTAPNAPLFPNYGVKNGQRNIDRHIDQITQDPSFRCKRLKKLGRAYNEKLKVKKRRSKHQNIGRVPPHKQSRVSKRSYQASLSGKIQPAGRKKSILDTLDTVWEYLKEIERAGDSYSSFMEGFIKEKNELLESVSEKRLLDAHIKETLKKKNVGIIKNHKSLYDSEYKLKPVSSSAKSFSKILAMIKPQDERETVDKLMWLLDIIIVFPVSDLKEVTQYRGLFFKTLNEALKQGRLEDEQTKESFERSFYDQFLTRKVAFNDRSGAAYITENGKKDKNSERPFAEVIKEADLNEKRALEDVPDKIRVYELAKDFNMDSKKLVEMLKAGGMNIINNMSTMDEEGVAMARDIVARVAPEVIAEQKIKPTVRRHKKKV